MYKEEPDLPNMENTMEKGKKKKVGDHNFLTERAKKKQTRYLVTIKQSQSGYIKNKLKRRKKKISKMEKVQNMYRPLSQSVMLKKK